MSGLKRYILSIISLLLFFGAAAQNADTKQQQKPAKQFKGIVLDANTRKPVVDVQLSSINALRTVVSNINGVFRMRLHKTNATILASKNGYYPEQVEVYGRDSVVIYMQSIAQTPHTNSYAGFANIEMPTDRKVSASSALETSQINNSYTDMSSSIAGRFAGLRVTNKSGMLGEGSLVGYHGVRSLLAENTPTLVVDGVPFLVDHRLSNVIGGYSADIFDAINLKEVSKITLLKGVDALPYGSLGSNGVLVVETERGVIDKTKVELQSINGISFINKFMPMLEGEDYKKYISDVASTRFSNVDQTVNAFPFLGAAMNSAQQKRYGYNTNWQKEVFTPAFSSDNVLKVKGGDAVVKYLLTAGYQLSNGVVEGTSRNRFYTTGNTNINFSKRFSATGSVSFSFNEMQLQEQGMSAQTNPLLAAYSYSPLNGIYQIDDNGNMMSTYSMVDKTIGVSNPVAILNGVDARNKTYNIMINLGFNYKLMKDLNLSGTFGIYHNYMKDDIFIGGKTSHAIAPLLGGLAENTVRSGSSEVKDYYVRVGLDYELNKYTNHLFKFNGGYQLVTARQQASSGSGINTTSDRYHNLTNVNASLGRSSGGYAEMWNWMNFYAIGSYSYKQQLFLNITGTADAASTYGKHSDRWFVMPGAALGWKINNSPLLRNVDAINNLTLRAEYSLTPNSRFSSRFGSHYYVLQMLRDVSGLVREGIPNHYIQPEKVENLNVGLDFGSLGDRFTLSVDLFQEKTRNMLVASEASAIYGESYIYKNSGAMRSQGIDVSASALLSKGNVQWRVGGNISFMKSEITSLGGAKEQILSLGDGINIINRVGEAPFSYYGYESQGVIASSEEAANLNLYNTSGYRFSAGDIKFRNTNNDNLINKEDMVVLGNSTPKFFGGFYTSVNYKRFSLFANFTYSYGSELYNGVRRYNESGATFSNQYATMNNRWTIEGQVTNIPRADFNNRRGNDRFSSRWIEDGSYIKLKEITLSYEINKKWAFFNGFRVFVTGENLLTFTDYTGMDPEFAYSYDLSLMGMDMGKIPVPKSVKLGLIMNF